MSARVLVAGVGNVFLSDDGFGVEVAHRLIQAGGFPDDVEVADFGIRGVHLAYQLLGGYEALVLIDATQRGETPGTISIIEANVAALGDDAVEAIALGGGAIVDGHGMDPASVLALLHSLGGSIGRVIVVGCEPARLAEDMGLSEAVTAAIEAAETAVRDIVEELSGSVPASAGHRGPNATKEEA